MAPHNHAEETVVVLDCKDAYVKYGSGPDSLEHTVRLEKGDLMHVINAVESKDFYPIANSGKAEVYDLVKEKIRLFKNQITRQ